MNWKERIAIFLRAFGAWGPYVAMALFFVLPEIHLVWWLQGLIGMVVGTTYSLGLKMRFIAFGISKDVIRFTPVPVLRNCLIWLLILIACAALGAPILETFHYCALFIGYSSSASAFSSGNTWRSTMRPLLIRR